MQSRVGNCIATNSDFYFINVNIRLECNVRSSQKPKTIITASQLVTNFQLHFVTIVAGSIIGVNRPHRQFKTKPNKLIPSHRNIFAPFETMRSFAGY